MASIQKFMGMNNVSPYRLSVYRYGIFSEFTWIFVYVSWHGANI